MYLIVSVIFCSWKINVFRIHNLKVSLETNNTKKSIKNSILVLCSMTSQSISTLRGLWREGKARKFLTISIYNFSAPWHYKRKKISEICKLKYNILRQNICQPDKKSAPETLHPTSKNQIQYLQELKIYTIYNSPWPRIWLHNNNKHQEEARQNEFTGKHK